MTRPPYVDISSHQPNPDLRAYWAAGHRDLMLKATEGTGYAWPQMQALAREWHSFGADARCGYYHWLYGTLSATAQYQWFWFHVSPVFRPGDWLMTDFEDVDPSRWVSDAQHLASVSEFDRLCAQHGPVHDYAPDWYIASLPLCVGYFRTRPCVASDYSHSPPGNRFGRTFVAHQFTDRAVVAGFATPVDYNRWLIEPAPSKEVEQFMPTLTPDQQTQLLSMTGDTHAKATALITLVTSSLTRATQLQAAVAGLGSVLTTLKSAVQALDNLPAGTPGVDAFTAELAKLPAELVAALRAAPIKITGELG